MMKGDWEKVRGRGEHLPQIPHAGSANAY